jgi:hypothetical protein
MNANGLTSMASYYRLRSMVANSWGSRVTVVSSDMRVWKAPEKCDILVSELLGSFGDNELSPECLDGAQRFLKGILQSSPSPPPHPCRLALSKMWV